MANRDEELHGEEAAERHFEQRAARRMNAIITSSAQCPTCCNFKTREEELIFHETDELGSESYHHYCLPAGTPCSLCGEPWSDSHMADCFGKGIIN